MKRLLTLFESSSSKEFGKKKKKEKESVLNLISFGWKGVMVQ